MRYTRKPVVRRKRRQPHIRKLGVERLERRLLLDATVQWDGAKLTIGWDNNQVNGESVRVSTVMDANLGTYVVVETVGSRSVYWDGSKQTPVVLAGNVQAISVTGSPLFDQIDLSAVTTESGFTNAAIQHRGTVTVDCTTSAPNEVFGDTIYLGAFGEKATGSPYADLIKCGPGGDTVNGSGGADTITGGAGDDQLTLGGTGIGPNFSTKRAIIRGGAGSDTIKGGNMHARLYAGAKNSIVTAGPWGDTLVGGGGSDTLIGGVGSDVIRGGKGDDIINGMGAPVGRPDDLQGGAGNSWIYLNAGVGVNPDGTANDYEPPRGNHPAASALVAMARNGNTPQDTFDVGDPIKLRAKGLRIPIKDNGEFVKSVTYYFDDNGLKQDDNGNWVASNQPDAFLEHGNPTDLDLGSVDVAATETSTDFPVDTSKMEPGTYDFFAIATASISTPWGVAIQGNYVETTITLKKGQKVGINAVVPQTQELLAGQPGVFDVTRDGSTENPLTVNYTLSGTATNGTDYSSLSGTVTIPAGSADATIDVSPLDDGDGDDGAASQSVIATLTSTSDYDVDPDASSATVNILEETPPTVTISATQPNAVENDANNQGEYVVTRTGATDVSLTVDLASSGTAVPGTNYDALPSSVTIPAGSQTAVLLVNALEDTPGGNDPETVTETIQPGSAYAVGSPDSADVHILEKPTSTVTIAATTPTTIEDGTTPGEFTVTRTAPYDSDLTVAYSMGGTAINGTDYQTLSGSITIPAGAPSVVFDVDPLDDGDDAGEPAGGSTVIATITPDPNVSYFVGSANNATVTIQEEPPPGVQIAVDTPQISENGTPGSFTVSRGGSDDEPLTVYFAFSGSASPGTDFTDPGTSVTIPAGSYAAKITIAPLDDGDGDDTQASETLTATLTSSPGYEIDGGYGSAAMTIVEEPIPQVTIVRQSDAVENPACDGSFLLSRTGPTTDPLTVTFSIGGTAIEGTDYTDVGTTVTIPAGQASAPLTISPIDDQQDEPSETVTVAIVNEPGTYAAMSPSSAQLTIEEDGTPTVTVATNTPTIQEAGPSGHFIVSRTGSIAQSLDVYYQVSADDPSDFQPLSGVVTIPAGDVAASIDVAPIDDGDGDDTLPSSQLSVALMDPNDGSYNIGTQNSASMTIVEDQPPVVEIHPYPATPHAVEGGPTKYVWIERSAPYTNAISVPYEVSGTAQPGIDYADLPGEVTIPAGSPFGLIAITALEDDIQGDSPGEYVTVALMDDNMGDYQLGANTSQTVDIDEAPTPTVTVSADADATEGGADGQFTVSRTAPYDQPLTVSYTVGGSAVAGSDYQALPGTVTIPAGSDSATIVVAALPDSAGEDDGSTTTVAMQIAASDDSSYTVGDAASAAVNINEEPLPIVNITADGDANEDGAPAEFTVTRNEPTDQLLTVYYAIGGSAIEGVDYAPPAGAVTIPAGSLSAVIDVTPIDDGDGDDGQGPETMIALLESSSAYAFGNSSSATINIDEEPPPIVTISADADANEDGDVGQCTISRTGPTDDPLTVSFAVGGSAIAGTDYDDIGTSVTIPAGESSASIEVTPIDDGDGDDAQASEDVQLTISPSSAYTVGADNAATVNIDEEPPPTVSLYASISSTDELGSMPGEFTVYRDGATDSALAVNYTLSGAAANGVDYQSLSGTVTIPAGDDSATIEVTPIDDGGDDPSVPSKGVVATLSADPAYAIEPYSASDTVTINEDSTVTIAATTATTEELGAPDGEFTVTRVGPTDEPLDVAYTLGGTAVNGTDYTTLTGDVLIPAGSATATIDVAPLDDGDGDDGQQSETVVATLSPGAYDLGDATSDTVTILEEPGVTVAATTPTTSEDGTSPGVFTFTRSGPTDQALNVGFVMSGSAISGTDYTAVGSSVTIPAGQTTATVNITPIDDLNDDDNPSETATLTLSSGSNYSLGDPSSATVTIDEEPPPTVTIAATTDETQELSGSPGVFTVSRTGPTDGALAVSYNLSGTALNGTDYQTLSGTVTIPDGQASTTFNVTPIDDLDDDSLSSESVVATLASSAAYVIGSPDSATVTIDEEPPPVVSITTATPFIAELGTEPGVFTVSRTGPTDGALAVAYTMSGAAINGTDYDLLSGTVTIPDGQASTTFDVTPIDDGDGDDGVTSEDATATLSPSSTYTIGEANQATVIIDEEPTVTITASTPTTTEGSGAVGEFTVTRSGAADLPLTVNYTLGGTAIAGTDYDSLSGQVVIPAGSYSAYIQIAPIDDGDGDDNQSSESVVATLSAGSAYVLGASTQATITIDEEPPPTVNIVAATPSVLETGSTAGVFTVSRTGPTDDALNVDYAVSGSATPGLDYGALSGSVTLAAGQSSAVIYVSPIDDGDGDDDGSSATVTASLQSSSAYLIGPESSATVAINEDAPPVSVSIAATEATTSEAGGPAGIFTVTASAAPTMNLTVSYTMSGAAQNATDYSYLSGQVTIPAGQTSATISVSPIDDGDGDDNLESEDATATLTSGTGYRLGSPTSATVTIQEEPPPITVSIGATVPTTSEGGAAPGTFTVSASAAPATDLTVYYSMSGAAQNGTDYSYLGGQVTIPAGHTSAAISISPLDDGDGDDNLESEDATATLTSGAGYLLGSPTSATVTIEEEPPPITVTIQATRSSTTEVGAEYPGVFTVNVSSPPTTDVTVNYTWSGTAQNGVDFDSLTGTVLIPAGQYSGEIDIVPIDDGDGDDGQTSEYVTVTLTAGSGYTIGGQSSDTVTIDEEPPGEPEILSLPARHDP